MIFQHSGNSKARDFFKSMFLFILSQVKSKTSTTTAKILFLILKISCLLHLRIHFKASNDFKSNKLVFEILRLGVPLMKLLCGVATWKLGFWTHLAKSVI